MRNRNVSFLTAAESRSLLSPPAVIGELWALFYDLMVVNTDKQENDRKNCEIVNQKLISWRYSVKSLLYISGKTN